MPEKLPVGRSAIYEFYGWSPKLYVGEDGRPLISWERDMMRQFILPAPMRLAWDRTVHIGKITLHKKAGPYLLAWLEEVHKLGLWDEVDLFGGSYNFRLTRGSAKLSMHALGAAIDIDPARNKLAAAPEDTNLGGTPRGLLVVSAAEKCGLTWGGRWKVRPDSMHFSAVGGE